MKVYLRPFVRNVITFFLAFMKNVFRLILNKFDVDWALLSDNCGRNGMYSYLTKGSISHKIYLELYVVT